jgi:hypothetical protein
VLIERINSEVPSLAAGLELSENSRLGFGTKVTAQEPGLLFGNLQSTLGMHVSLRETRGGSRIQTWNRYAYVANGPLNAIDPLGLKCQPTHVPTGANKNGQITWAFTILGGCGSDANLLESLSFDDQIGYNDPNFDNMWVSQNITGDLFTISVTVSNTFQNGKFNLTNPFTKPNQKPGSTAQQQCLASYNNSGLGSLVRFFSLYNLATNFSSAWPDWTVLPAAKIAVAQGAKWLSQQIGGGEFLSVASGTAVAEIPSATSAVVDLAEAAGADVALPTITLATATDFAVHQICSGNFVPLGPLTVP